MFLGYNQKSLYSRKLNPRDQRIYILLIYIYDYVNENRADTVPLLELQFYDFSLNFLSIFIPSTINST
jgi:hypothetical protein